MFLKRPSENEVTFSELTRGYWRIQEGTVQTMNNTVHRKKYNISIHFIMDVTVTTRTLHPNNSKYHWNSYSRITKTKNVLHLTVCNK